MSNNNQRNKGKIRTQNEIVSHALSYLLRHGAPKEGVFYDKHGGVSIDTLLKMNICKGQNREFINKIVENCKKQRFKIYHDDDNIERICAVQGHSFKVEPYLSKNITLDNYKELGINPETVVHGSYNSCLKSIKERGLSKMGRTHIHLGMNGAVISGMRKSCEVMIFVNILDAIKDGYTFTLSNNRVILTPGNDSGFLPVKYISKIVERG